MILKMLHGLPSQSYGLSSFIFIFVMIAVIAALVLVMWLFMEYDFPHWMLDLGKPPKSKALSIKNSNNPRVVDYLIDPDAKLPHVFVPFDAINLSMGTKNKVLGYTHFTEQPQHETDVKLTRSGTGFRVYNHPMIAEGQWLPCR